MHKVSKSILHTRSKDVNRAFPGYKMGACKKFDVSVYLLVELVLSSTASWTSVSCSSLLLFHCDLRAAAGDPGYIMDATANPKRIIPALMAVEILLRLNLDIGLVPAGEGNKATDDDVDAMALSRFSRLTTPQSPRVQCNVVVTSVVESFPSPSAAGIR